MPSRMFPNVLTDDLVRSRQFYTELLGLQVVFESDWYIQLRPPGDETKMLGLWRRDHELVPEAHRAAPRGMIMTFVVDDVDSVYQAALRSAVTVVQPPEDRSYGQRSLLVLDPDGLVVDISTPIEPSSN